MCGNVASFAVALVFCICGSAAQYDSCTNGTVADIGNGRCDVTNNIPSCGFDGGDCCPCTCDLVLACADSDFDCLYPDCGNLEATSEGTACVEEWKSDGFCDHQNNNPSCGYDGGDCCQCSCLDSPSFVCGSNGFDCRDPACFDPAVVAEFPDCTGDWMLIGDGNCSTANNNPMCGYDGGDCCLCSCIGEACSSSDFECLDPDAGDEVFECKRSPPSTLPCSAGVQHMWIVESSAQVQALAEAVNCSGGSFEVEWRGNIVVSEPIYVLDDTILAVTGAGLSAVMTGNAATRLFTVVNATLHVSSVNITSGASIVGGAIAASGSVLTFDDRTSFIGNKASNGGAVYLSEGSSVSCVGGSTLSLFDNRADFSGGAMYVTGGSVVSCGGSWINNTAGTSGGALKLSNKSRASLNTSTVFHSNSAVLRDGGAVHVSEGSSVSCLEGNIFSDNRAGFYGGAMFAEGGSLISCGGSWLNNTAGLSGGALRLDNGSSVSWNTSTVFSSNSAALGGGALAILDGSSASWSGVTTFTSNIAPEGQGGALFIYDASSVSWSAESNTVFDVNSAGLVGGAMMVGSSSRVSCTEETISTFSANSAHASGGAVYAISNAVVSFGGITYFDGNTAVGGADSTTPGVGGALSVSDSTASWGGRTTFVRNRANVGGVLYADNASSVDWSGQTVFAHNTASFSGGALASLGSRASWVGDTIFFNNSAHEFGGGLTATSSNISWSGNTTFASNVATGGTGFGGALLVTSGSSLSWGGERTAYEGNFASSLGGALMVSDSEVSWDGSTSFSRNSAQSGGAISLSNGSSMAWTGHTEFSANMASADGGAVASPVSDTVYNPQDSVLIVDGATSFFNNTSGANGGSVALLGACAIEIGAVRINFVRNHAAIGGGAVFVSGTGFGPAFTDVSFVSNSAQVGGAVSIQGSGNAKEAGDVEVPYPTTFNRCLFVGNEATATGGAIDSASGQDAFVSSTFSGNTAGTGGALRLAGTAYFEHCSFLENISDDVGGPAVSNIGSISRMVNCSFSGNVFNCPDGMFLDFNSSDPYEAVCAGCPTGCDGCFFEQPPLLPVCTTVMDHAASAGGNITLETISIDSGYWRATTSSKQVLACYHADACLGGMTQATDYCREGYEGPYCSVCANGYTEQLSFACSKCADSTGGIVLVAALVLVLLLVAVAVMGHTVSSEVQSCWRNFYTRHANYFPLQSVKIIIVSWQILTQFASVANVTFPAVYESFLDGVDLLNFDLAWILSAACVVDVDFHDRLLTSTISPIIIVVLLAVTCAIAVHVNRGATNDIVQKFWSKLVPMVLPLTFLVYSSVSSILFQSFACDKLDGGKNYLRSDYRIDCDSSKHKRYQVYAGIMILVYTVGIPFFYGCLLYMDRDVRRDGQADQEPMTARITWASALWKPYKQSVFYYEVVECGRRVLLAGVVVFIFPNTAAQVAITAMLAFAFVVFLEVLSPYESSWDTWTSRIGHMVVFVSMYLALLLKVDVSDERANSQRVFGIVLVVTHVCMILLIVVEAFWVSCQASGATRIPPRILDWMVLRRTGGVRVGANPSSVLRQPPFV